MHASHMHARQLPFPPALSKRLIQRTLSSLLYACPILHIIESRKADTVATVFITEPPQRNIRFAKRTQAGFCKRATTRGRSRNCAIGELFSQMVDQLCSIAQARVTGGDEIRLILKLSK